MMAGIPQIKRWLAARDPALSILVSITLVGLLARWIFVIGTALPDDPGYATPLFGFILRGGYPSLGDMGQAEFRPAWLLPIGASIHWLGWTAHGIALYPIITGGLIPLLTALWLRRNLPRGSQAPVVCALILAGYPVLFVDSLMWVNEVPLIFWSLLCVNLFGGAYARLAESPHTACQHLSWLGFSVLAGAAFAAAYQVKVTALPILGIWLTTEVLLQVVRRGWPGRGRWILLWAAAAVFLLPALGVQLFYQARTGHFLGNIQAEMRMYAVKLPENYLSGNLQFHDLFFEYVEQLFLPFDRRVFRCCCTESGCGSRWASAWLPGFFGDGCPRPKEAWLSSISSARWGFFFSSSSGRFGCGPIICPFPSTAARGDTPMCWLRRSPRLRPWS